MLPLLTECKISKMFAFHVTCKSTKKVIEVPESEISNLKETLKRAFGIQEDFKVQLYDNTWDDWVDTQLSNLPQKGKLQLIISTELPTTLPDFPETLSPTYFSDQASTSSSIFSLSESGSFETSNILPLIQVLQEDCGQNISSDDIAAETKKRKKVSETKQQTQWPSNFEMPQLPVVLEGKLNNEVVPNDRERRQIIQSLFDYMAAFTSYPLPHQYLEAVECLLKKHPFLVKETIPGARPQEYWRLKLMDKFRNERKHMPVQRKKSRPGMNQAAPQSKTDQIDDLASLGKHKMWLKEEAKRTKQNFSKVCLLMDITYTVRRKWITDEKPTLSDIKDEYPCLFNQKQILLEMKKVETSFDTYQPQVIIGNLEAYSLHMINQFQSKKTVNDVVSHWKRVLPSLDEEHAKEGRVLTALLLLPCFFKGEKLSAFLLGDDKDGHSTITSHPIVCYKGEVYNPTGVAVQAENVLLCKCKSILEALCCLICSYFVFHIEYPKECKNSLLFIQTMMGFDRPTTRSVQSLIQRLFGYSSKE